MSVENRKTIDAPPDGEAVDRYLPLAHALCDALREMEPSTGTIAWAGAARDVFGGLADVRDASAWKARIHPDDRGRVAAGFETAVRGLSVNWVDEYRFLRTAGGYADVVDRCHIVRGLDGRASRVIGAMQDVTQR